MREISIPEPRSFKRNITLEEKNVEVKSVKAPEIVSGWRKSWIRLKFKWTLLRILRRCYNNPLDWIRGLQYLAKRRRSILGNHRIRKLVEVDGLFYMDLYVPGWNDVANEQFIFSELIHFKTHHKKVNRFNQVFLSITKKCPMQCEHCSAWDTLNMKDPLGADEFGRIIKEVHQMGFSQLYFTGGEPMVKFHLLESLITQLPIEVKSWVATSGFQLTREKAQLLKKAGLTGVFISLDHYEKERHNTFRNHNTAYFWALEAARNALDADLLVTFSVCLNDDICRREELLKYMNLAKDCGVHFVQFLEPQSVGRFKNRNVSLSKESVSSAEALYLELNYGKDYLEYPLIHYLGYYHRRIGCFGGGKQVIYIDADGNLNACPFCQASKGNLLEGSIREKVNALAHKGCELF
jgi:MoaA/NifB/PqqE/SkfB family radical SAM enzyme